ncbi:MAG: hypothetical protein JJE19_07485, partial [Methanosarcinales archaeon]|nr:hypothetical protein [Methanosarcinales archaeon]
MVIWMIPDWAKNLLVKLAIGTVILFALLNSMGTAGASDIEVSPSHRDVSLTFGQSADNTASVSFTITNNENSTVSGNMGISPTPPPHITLTGPSSFTCGANLTTTVQFTIVALPSPSGEDETYTFTIDIGGKPVTVTVTITYHAKIEVSPVSIDFGRVPRTYNPTETVTISEVYGYKTVDIRSRISGNSWLTATLTDDAVKKGSPVTVTFQLTPGYPDHNDYSWTFFLSTITSHTTISPNSVYIKAYILMPAKLGRLYDEELDITFDKPKGTVSKYERDIDVRVRNEGDETMQVSSSVSESPGGGISIEIIDSHKKDVTGKSSKNIELRVVAPYNAPEGTYRGKLHIYAEDKDGN